MLFKKSRNINLDMITGYDHIKKNKMDNFTFLNEKYSKKGQVVLFGDSITEIFNSYELFYEYSQKNNLAVYNRGISGDTSDRLLERLHCNALNIEPSKIVILIGTNDFRPGLNLDFTTDNIDKILSEIENTLPTCQIILEAVYPVNKNMSSASRAMVGGRKNNTIKELNKLIKAVANNHNCTFIDLWDVLIDKKGNLREDYCYDGLHLNAKGFEAVTNELLKVL